MQWWEAVASMAAMIIATDAGTVIMRIRCIEQVCIINRGVRFQAENGMALAVVAFCPVVNICHHPCGKPECQKSQKIDRYPFHTRHDNKKC